MCAFSVYLTNAPPFESPMMVTPSPCSSDSEGLLSGVGYVTFGDHFRVKMKSLD